MQNTFSHARARRYTLGLARASAILQPYSRANWLWYYGEGIKAERRSQRIIKQLWLLESQSKKSWVRQFFHLSLFLLAPRSAAPARKLYTPRGNLRGENWRAICILSATKFPPKFQVPFHFLDVHASSTSQPRRHPRFLFPSFLVLRPWRFFLDSTRLPRDGWSIIQPWTQATDVFTLASEQAKVQKKKDVIVPSSNSRITLAIRCDRTKKERKKERERERERKKWNGIVKNFDLETNNLINPVAVWSSRRYVWNSIRALIDLSTVSLRRIRSHGCSIQRVQFQTPAKINTKRFTAPAFRNVLHNRSQNHCLLDALFKTYFVISDFRELPPHFAKPKQFAK